MNNLKSFIWLKNMEVTLFELNLGTRYNHTNKKRKFSLI